MARKWKIPYSAENCRDNLNCLFFFLFFAFPKEQPRKTEVHLLSGEADLRSRIEAHCFDSWSRAQQLGIIIHTAERVN